ncbi:hypothetical protein DFH07DRAFT_269970 [Mycena maculata]|uniref:Uncharacterized protein n=1 Tax=Mycena maculata TaxID=230809 RepID=A0AAD7JRD0_9AGAR|nr:hypothetical protein DFH07DRAFT_269970 [Mycena maculata]
MCLPFAGYATDYEKHLGQLRAHLSGNTGHPLSPSFIPPAGYWTSREKDIFFHALALHSRLRPDLIADSVKSKNILDVCAYIDALERAAATQPLQASSLRSSLEGAMEVSDSWVQHEEEQASEITKLEPEWEAEAKRNRRSVLLAGRFQDEPTYWNWKEEREREWEKQDTLAKLGRHHLRVLDRFIRDAEVAIHEAEPLRDTEPPVAHPPSRFQDELIDPVLLALPSAEPPHPISQLHAELTINPPYTPEPSPNSSTQPLPSSFPASGISDSRLSPDSRRRLTKRLYMRRMRAQATGVEPNLATTKLIPGRKSTRVYVSKPRPKKYKPRKPQTKRDDPDMADEEAVPQDPIPNARPTPPPSLSGGLEDADDETAGRIYYLMRGITEPYKIMSTLKDQGIDAKVLAEDGLDIFNLAKVSKLMELFQQAYTDPDEKNLASSISHDSIKLLRTILTDFISNLVHRTISLREQEVVLKRNYKVWRLTKEDEITPENVLDALQMDALKKHNLFSDCHEDSPPNDDNDPPGESVEQRFVEDETMLYARLSLHRELVPPFVQFPGKPENTSLMPTETDVDELMAELDDESELDKLDRQLEGRYEADLWQESKA